jgi:hypothetical protein
VSLIFLSSEQIASLQVVNKMMTEHPTGAEIRSARIGARLSQKECATIVGLSHGSRWAEFEANTRKIDTARWELFLLKIGRHPDFELSQRIQSPRSDG